MIQRCGVQFILSNNQVLDKSSFGTPGTDPVTQPGLVDNNCNPGMKVASLSEAAVLKPNPCNGVCTGPAPDNLDAAIAQVVGGAVDPSGSILDLGATTSTNILAAPPSLTPAVPANVLATSEGVALGLPAPPTYNQSPPLSASTMTVPVVDPRHLLQPSLARLSFREATSAPEGILVLSW